MNKVQFYQPFSNKLSNVRFDHNSFTPASNLFKDENGYSIEIAIPGFNKSEVEVQLKDNKLTIKGKVENQSPETTEKFIHQGFGKKPFSMSFNLSESIDQNAIKAEFQNGVLNVTLGFKEEVKAEPKNITIN